MSDLLVIESKYILSGDKYTEMYEALANQKDNGLVLLLPGMTAKIIPEDVDIQLETPYKKKEPEVMYKWTPCSEQLPEKNGWYLITVKDSDEILRSRYNCVYKTWGYYSDDYVIAWFPMPDIYKEEK